MQRAERESRPKTNGRADCRGLEVKKESDEMEYFSVDQI